jgi:hypothetical protein
MLENDEYGKSTEASCDQTEGNQEQTLESSAGADSNQKYEAEVADRYYATSSAFKSEEARIWSASLGTSAVHTVSVLVHFTNPILQKSLLRPNNGEW